MPLIRCPDCHKEISESAISCPNCGLPRPQYELMTRERKAAEDAAAEERRRTIQYVYIGAAACALVAVTLFAVMILTSWTRAELGTKAKELLVGAVFGGVAYALYQQATRMGKAQ